MDVSGELLQEATAASGEAERVREAARVLDAAADEVPSLVQAVAQRFEPAIWRGESLEPALPAVRVDQDRRGHPGQRKTKKTSAAAH